MVKKQAVHDQDNRHLLLLKGPPLKNDVFFFLLLFLFLLVFLTSGREQISVPPSPLFRNAAAPLRRGISEASGSEICFVPIFLAPVFLRSPHIYIYIHIHVCMYVCVYIYIYIHVRF